MGVKVRLLEGGYCTHKEKMIIKGGKNKEVKIPSMFALIIHPKHGVILYDTGYTKRFYKETKKFPFKLYAKLTPVYVRFEDTAAYKLMELKIDPSDVKYIIISHFHADHVAALKDFPKAKFICMKDGYDFVKNLKGIKATKAGFLKGLLPDDFESRAIFLDQDKQNYQISPIKSFNYTFDVFDDGLIKLIPLEGHYKGHLGALIKSDSRNKNFFLIADSCWKSKSYKENILPHFLASIIMDNPRMYKKTLSKLHEFHKENPDTYIIPSHCEEMFKKFVKK